MPWPKGKSVNESVLNKRHTGRAQTLLIRAKLSHQGDQQIPNLGSILHWDTLCLREPQPGKRTRRYVSITCGKCHARRWIQYDNIIKQLRKSSFMGVCQDCFHHLTWEEKHRKQPLRRRISSNGYIKVYLGRHHPWADAHGEMYEHRLVMAQELNRPLRSYEHVHHLNNKRTDNRPENLKLMTTQENQVIRALQEHIRNLEQVLTNHGISLPL